MRYSLLNRFQGCVIGAELGKAYACIKSEQVDSWSKTQLLTIKSLIGKGQFDLDDWNRSLAAEFPDLNSKTEVYRGELLGSSLPIALFYHENEIKLKKNLLSLAEIWQDDVELREGLLVVGYTVAQSLQEKLSSRTLIPQIIAFTDDGCTSQKLVQVKTLLEQGSGLETVTQLFCQDTQLSSAVALAMYCFLSTLEDFRLSILRAARTSIHPITPTIVGALAGAYNSTVGIPASMRVVLSRQTALEIQKTDLVQMLDLVNNLLATWSGMYDQTPANVLASVTAIAAPSVIR